jgi:short-subunit dehydrogenase
MQELRNRVVVITGASSGIGQALALAFARQQARLVLAARRQGALEAVARLCTRNGAGDAIVVPTDVADATQTAALAEAAVRAFGGIDIWANIAGVTAAGPFESTPPDTYTRLIAVNLIGVMNGSHAALTHMLGLGGGKGTIINMASLAGRIPYPFMAAYSASKFGVAGFTDALRHEVLARSAVQVCGVHPAFVDTPALCHAANHTGRRLRPMPPILDPEAVAEAVLRLAQHPQRALHLGALHATVPAFSLAPELSGRA